MKIDIERILVYALLGVLLYLQFFGKPAPVPGVVTEVRTDTVTKVIERITVKEPIYTHTTQQIKIPYIVPQTGGDSLIRPINDSITIELPVNQYKDTLQVDSATLIYDHLIAGYLQGSNYKISYPVKTITKTVTKEREFDLFLVTGYQMMPKVEFRMGFDFVAKRWKAGYQYGRRDIDGLNKGTHNLNFGYKIYSK